ncbi:MAG: hypothetical protein ACOYMN_24500, partial [Roseimicrobium sp.]
MTRLSFLHRVPPWLLAFSPALLVLAMLDPLLIGAPFQDSWVFIWQYLDLCEGRYTWAEFFQPHNAHPSAVGKALYFAVLRWGDGDVALLPRLTWIISFVIALGVRMLSKPLWIGHPWRGAALCFFSNLAIFSASAGHTWVWDFVFQNALPGMFLVIALVALSSHGFLAVRLAVALLSAVLATFSFGSGFFVGVLLTPAVWCAVSGPWKMRAAYSATWFFVGLFTAWIALSYCSPTTTNQAAAGGQIAHLLSQPTMAAQYVFLLLGLPLGQGSVVEPETLCALMGVLLCGVLGVSIAKLWREHSLVRWQEALPWLILCSWSMLNALLICYGRMRYTLSTAVAPRYVTFVLFFTVGVVMLAAVAWRNDRGVGPRAMALWHKSVAGLVALLLVAHAYSWVAGYHHMRLESVRMRQEVGAFSLAPVVRPLDEQIWWYLKNGDSLQWAQGLRKLDRLREISFASSADVAAFRTAASPLAARWASWTLWSDASNGALVCRGTCGLNKDLFSQPDLVLLSAQAEGGPEQFIAFAKPKLPEDFMDRELLRRVHHEHYFGWE